jgi:hypothetical protein
VYLKHFFVNFFESSTSNRINEAPRSKLRGILSGIAPKPYPPSPHKLRRGRLAIPLCSKLQSILAKANELDSAGKKGIPLSEQGEQKISHKRKERQMKEYLLLIALLIILSGCAFGVYDGPNGFQGAVIGVPYAYGPYYPDRHYYVDSYGYGDRHYPSSPGRYSRGYGGHKYFR